MELNVNLGKDSYRILIEKGLLKERPKKSGRFIRERKSR